MTGLAHLLPTERGKCFQAAIVLAADPPKMLGGRDVVDVRLAHGTPIGQGSENFGRRFWHAWCEARLDDGEWVVLDASTPGRMTCVPRSRYYEVGQLSNRTVWRYSRADAARNGERHGHFGPWLADADDRVEV